MSQTSRPAPRSAQWLILALLALFATGSAAATTPEEAEIQAQLETLQQSISELKSRELAVKEEMLLVEARQRQVQLELARVRPEYERLQAEARALALEARGEPLEADFVRQRAALRAASKKLSEKSYEIEIENLQTVKLLELELRSLQEARLGVKTAADRRAAETDRRQMDELVEQLAVARADIERRKNEIQREQAAIYHSEFELERDHALEQGDTQVAANYQERISRAAEKRAELEIESVFIELRQELQAQHFELRRARSSTTDQRELIALSEQLKVISEDQQRLFQSRRTFQNEAELQRIQHQLGHHMRRLESARGAASAEEAGNLEEEIQRLKVAATQFLKKVLHGTQE